MNYIFLYLLMSFYSAIFCQVDKNLDEYWRQRDSVFNVWRNDTLNTLKSYFNDSLNFPMKSIIYYPSDSLKDNDTSCNFVYDKAEVTYIDNDKVYLDIKYYYSKQINKDSIENEKGKIGLVLSMIEEVDDLPQNFRISFTEYVFYFPSPTLNLKYDFVSEYKDIKISSYSKDFEYIEYGYIRGRIDSKRIFKSVTAPLKFDND